MKRMTKALSLLLALIMAVTCMSVGSTAFAADQSQCATVYFNGIENNSYIDDALYYINNERAAKGLNPLTLDSTLTEIAKQRAKEGFIYRDYDDIALPNGDPVTSYYQAYMGGALYSTDYSFYSVVDAQSISKVTYAAAYYDNTYANSVGVGIFTCGDESYAYVVYSSLPAFAPYTNFTDTNVTASVNTLVSNIELEFEGKINQKRCYYTLNSYLYCPKGCGSDDIPISNDQVTYKSSKSSVAKVKNGKLYPKKNGNYKFTVTLKSNPAVTASSNQSVSGLDNPAITVTYAKSTKSKKMTLKWKKDITDASGYEIQYATDKKFKKNKKTVVVKGKKNASKTISKLKSKKTYYVRVRAYLDQGSGEKIYGGWSKVKAIKVK
ncbi:MAG: fibronectin type III domain-containing protein [Eubacteriales bacterium]|nr:fibronectin type III domain-containing protein [Eubacteriales bacterium]